MISRSSAVGLRALVATGIGTVLLLASAQQGAAQQQPRTGEQPPPPLRAAPDQQPPSDPPVLTPSDPIHTNDDDKQSKRILWIFPNYRAVSANTQLAPLSLRNKFWLATRDSFDYSSFVTDSLRRRSSEEFLSGVWKWRKSLWPLLLARCGRPGSWKLYDRSDCPRLDP